MAEETKKTDEVKYNFGSDQLSLLASLNHQAAQARIARDYIKWYLSLSTMKMQIISRLTDAELGRLTRVETVIKRYINCGGYDKVNAAIELYETHLRKLMDRKGFLLPSKEDRSNLFGIPGR